MSGSRAPRVLPAGPRLAAKARAERRARRVAVARRAAWVSAVLLPFVAIGWLLLASPWLVVHRVVVTGESRVSLVQVLGAAEVRVGTPLARVDTGAVAARIRALGPVASVSVTRSWPSTLRIAVVERTPVAAVAAAAGAWTLVDGSGTLLGTVAALPSGVVRLVTPHVGPADAATRAALTVLHALPPALRRQVQAVAAATPEQVVLSLTAGRSVVWGGVADGAAKAMALVALLRLPGHVYDVSSPGVVTRR